MQSNRNLKRCGRLDCMIRAVIILVVMLHVAGVQASVCTEVAFRADLNNEMLKYSSIMVDLQRARLIRTSTHPRTLPDLLRPLTIKIDEIHSGIPGGGFEPLNLP